MLIIRVGWVLLSGRWVMCELFCFLIGKCGDGVKVFVDV